MNPPVTTIRRTAPDTFTAIISGTEWYSITPVSRFYQSVMDAISAEEPVVDAPVSLFG